MSTVLLALPLAVALHGQISEHLGSSMAAKAAAEGVNNDWWNEFLAQATGVGQTFVPAILGFAAVLKNLSGVADSQSLSIVIASVVASQIVVAMFLVGGVLDRLARDRALGAGAFFAACGVYFVRFLRLGIIAAAVYWVLFVSFHTWLFDAVYPRLTTNLTVERTAFFYRVALYVIFAVPVLFANVVFDYAKIRAVVEDRRSMIGALSAGARFVIRNPATLGLYALDTLLFLLVIGLYFLVAPGGSSNLLAFAVGQLYIVLRVVVRLQFAASQTALFQGRLAHAGYVARPVPKWPDSPAAEAIGPGV
ncbi:MAG: hypothetical protein Q7R30_12525 [Acidobacteriota bacterium]|nr:hypothetical protein [Acidobacteriota bacterium]